MSLINRFPLIFNKPRSLDSASARGRDVLHFNQKMLEGCTYNFPILVRLPVTIIFLGQCLNRWNCGHGSEIAQEVIDCEEVRQGCNLIARSRSRSGLTRLKLTQTGFPVAAEA